MEVEVLPPLSPKVDEWAQRISTRLTQCAEAILDVGRMLCQAKQELRHGEFLEMVDSRLRFSASTAQRLMAVARDPRITNTAHAQYLPPSWMTLYELTRLPDPVLEEAFEQGRITPEMRRKDAVRLLREAKNGHHVEPVAGPVSTMEPGRFVDSFEALQGETFSCIYADPPWSYQNQGTRASTDNHYETLTVGELCEIDVGSLAAPQAHLHLWTTNAFLFECPRIFEAWGFEFKSGFIWVKSTMGLGNYWRNSHEYLLLAVRGGMVAQSRDLMSWMESPRARHSEKPERVREFVERLSPGPYLELFGRRKARGWTVFGNECIPHTERMF